MQKPATPITHRRYKYHHHRFPVFSFALLFCFLFCSPLLAVEKTASKKKENTYEDSEIYLRTVYRSPEQLAAFYEGREFPQEAIKRITQSCYFTIILKNKTDDILWLEIDNWQFSANSAQNNQIIQRYNRAYWNKQWDEINLKQAFRSTFGWTLMPDVRDLRAGEGVGGSIPIPMQTDKFSVTLNFATGKDKKGKMKSVTLPNIQCKQDEK